MKLVIPMAGEGKRFTDAGFKDPKPFIEVLPGVKMIELVLKNLNADSFSQVILLTRADHMSRVVDVCKSLSLKNVSIVVIDKLTEGAACSLLYAYDYINCDESVMIANSDQFIENFDISEFIEKSSSGGSILCFEDISKNKKWSYAMTNSAGRVLKVAEKDPISSLATCGIYYFTNGRELVRSIISMIRQNIRTNNEFYICPVFNEYRLPVNIFLVDSCQMKGLGTPEDLDLFRKERS